MGVYARSGRVDHCAAHRGVPLPLLEGIQALYPYPHSLLAHTVVYGCETTRGSGYMAVRVPGGPPYPPPSDQAPPVRVDHPDITVMMRMQALYPFPDSLLPTSVGWEGETTWGVHGRVVRVPGEAPYPVHPGPPPPGCGRPRDDHTDDGYAGAVPLPRPSPSNTSWVGG